MLNTTKRILITLPTLLFPCLALADDKIEFNRHVLPILSNHCYVCHGPDAATREAGLRLDQRDSATGKADSGKSAITPGDVQASELIRRITTNDPDERMPPAEGHKPLNASQIAILKAWIKQGAGFQQHWAFVAPKQPKIPQPKNRRWPKNNIDHFVLERLERDGKKPAREATRETLIRRVAFDLTGLPPTLEEIFEFVVDQNPKAYEEMVNHYLASPAYGEHMARHWLDLARYADTNGYQYDTEREQWIWRDWVINAYNKNKPFNEFTIEQLAGDLLPKATDQQKLATGFNRNHGITIEGGIIDEEYRTEYVMDRLVTTGEVWLALTIGCARCHEHKFDPISQKEFYQLYAFFNQVPEKGMRGFTPSARIPSPLASISVQKNKSELARLKLELKKSVDVDPFLNQWAKRITAQPESGWLVVEPTTMKSSGGTTLKKLPDHSVLANGANPRHDVYDITAQSDVKKITAVRLEALTHKSLPGGGPGRHSNSNFVLSEFELTAVSLADPSQKKTVKFKKAIADYSQKGYEVDKAIDGNATGNNGWAVDGPTRKLPATAVFIAESPFGFEQGTELQFRLRHEAGFATHGVGRPRLSITRDAPSTIKLQGIPSNIRQIAGKIQNQRTKGEQKQLRDYFLAHHNPQQALKQRIAAIEKQIQAAVPATMIMQDLAKPRATFLLERGQYNEPRDQVSADVPSIFPAMAKTVPKNRLGFANWLVDPRHPLTARVAVNRYWQRIFGLGLVKTSEDFGIQGELPSHPELLDWLALEFIRSGWDVKQMQRLILTSATYRQTSHVGANAYQDDPENRLLARGPRMRLDAEEIRDAILATSGLLVQQLGGKSVYPYQPKGLWLELNNRPSYSKEYARGKGDDLYRRSMYTFWKRTVPSPMLKTLDAPEREFCTIRRSRTNTPLQALLLLNGPQFVEAARKLAERMLIVGGDTTDDKITYGFRLVTARMPSDEELAVFRQAYQSELNYFNSDKSAALKLLQVGDSPLNPKLNHAQWAAFTSLTRLFLNLDEAITKG
ncbi:MAG: PSD1 and planctomycete cytochrome C domain-containing protein [Planctomycetes bacterium]|nr:PSD1 and planctomycete cytochrome C domain-containing protein [Planctomycetota bacterium]MCH9725342.1 PSD1 and planctomycete cytochrome C domain-containing protein [Planctomycetota bacterium]MCH9779438.1 PSD1 and planctomycete cytochrome C domain-containing protein [Planctomycetota bacterium]MCH9793107.1 PSD1 and planctomycete cytochrome C domain-containing protein [Planctomycetota bacterium]